MGTSIRPAAPDDAAFLAKIMLIAARSHLDRGFWEIAFDRSEAGCLKFLEQLALTRKRSWCHYSNFIVLEADGQPAAALCGYYPREDEILALTRATSEAGGNAGFTEQEIMAAQERAAPMVLCMPDETEGAWIVENIATLPEFRRRGLIHTLLLEILEEGRRKGYRLAQTAFLLGNTPARRAYEKVGFKVVDEKRHPDFEATIGSPGVAWLLRDL